MKRYKCDKCGAPLGEHHEGHCDFWGQVVPSECAGAVEDATQAVKLAADYERGIAEGRRLERAAVVADLRKRARALEALSSSRSMALLVIAQDYEAGEHKETT